MKKILAAIAFLAISVVGAQAATVATATGSGSYVYDDPSGPVTLSNVTLNGSFSGNPNVAGHYALTYEMTAGAFTGGNTYDLGVFAPINLVSVLDGLPDVVANGAFSGSPGAFTLDFSEIILTGAAFTAIYTDVLGGPLGFDHSGTFTVTASLAAVPIPATLPLLLLGVGGIAVLPRRKEGSASAA